MKGINMDHQGFANSMTDKFLEKLKRLDEGVEMAQAAIDHIGLDKTIDEVALRFSSQEDVAFFIKHAVRAEGVQLFNYAVDRVDTYPLRSQYTVQYWFLTTPRGYRLECMYIEPGSGHSPLHSAYTQQHSFETPVHYSFKCFDPAQYEQARKIIEASEWTLAQNCHSTYGSFAYYLTDEITDHALELRGYTWDNAYIKPRMNSRDSYPKANDAFSNESNA